VQECLAIFLINSVLNSRSFVLNFSESTVAFLRHDGVSLEKHRELLSAFSLGLDEAGD